MHFTVEIPKLHSVETEGKNITNGMMGKGQSASIEQMLQHHHYCFNHGRAT